jgi:hypothetical protein
MTSLKIFYDENHFTSKQTNHKLKPKSFEQRKEKKTHKKESGICFWNAAQCIRCTEQKKVEKKTNDSVHLTEKIIILPFSRKNHH